MEETDREQKKNTDNACFDSIFFFSISSSYQISHAYLSYLGSFDLLFDEGGVHTRILQLFYNILGVFKRTQ